MPRRRGRGHGGGWLIGTALLLLVALGPLLGLALADFLDTAGSGAGLAGRTQAVIANGSRLHYAVHLVAGRVLDVYPPTHQAALAQYWKASFHARTDRQLALVTSQLPSTTAERVADAVDVVADGVGWSLNGVAKLSARVVEETLERTASAQAATVS